MKGLVVYRILSFLVGIFSVFFAMFLAIMLPLAFVAPGLLLIVFAFLCVVLYVRFASRFHVRVIVMQQNFTRRQKDWLQANGIVAGILSVLCIFSGLEQLKNLPSALTQIQEMQKDYYNQVTITTQQLKTWFIILLAIFSTLLIHIVWTFALVRANKHKMEENQ